MESQNKKKKNKIWILQYFKENPLFVSYGIFAIAIVLIYKCGNGLIVNHGGTEKNRNVLFIDSVVNSNKKNETTFSVSIYEELDTFCRYQWGSEKILIKDKNPYVIELELDFNKFERESRIKKNIEVKTIHSLFEIFSMTNLDSLTMSCFIRNIDSAIGYFYTVSLKKDKFVSIYHDSKIDTMPSFNNLYYYDSISNRNFPKFNFSSIYNSHVISDISGALNSHYEKKEIKGSREIP